MLITGVSHFSKVSIFSDLNNLENITITKSTNDLVGLTQQEVENTFDEELEKLSTKHGIDKSAMVNKIKDWYNGYSWGGPNTLYNPFSLLNFIKYGEFDNFWIDTGTPSFLIKEVRNYPSNYIFTEEEIIVGIEGLKDLNTDKPDPVTLMFQTGFLTIKQMNRESQTVVLTYPNREVKDSVLTFITTAYSFEKVSNVKPLAADLRVAFMRNDIARVIKVMDTLFVNIPNELWRNAKEAFYHGLIHNSFQLLGISLHSEVSMSDGRMDALVKTATHIYVLEFKLDKTADAALQQILDKGYLRPYQLDARKKVAVGINFSSEQKAVKEYIVKEIDY